MKCIPISQSHDMHYQDAITWFITQTLFLQGCMKYHQYVFPKRCMKYHYDILQRCLSTKVFDIRQGYHSKLLSARIIRILFFQQDHLDIFLTKILVSRFTWLILDIYKDIWNTSSTKVPESYFNQPHE